jgi:hypothetical protein
MTLPSRALVLNASMIPDSDPPGSELSPERTSGGRASEAGTLARASSCPRVLDASSPTPPQRRLQYR